MSCSLGMLNLQGQTNYTPGVAQVVDAGHRPGWPAEAPKNPQHEVILITENLEDLGSLGAYC